MVNHLSKGVEVMLRRARRYLFALLALACGLGLTLLVLMTLGETAVTRAANSVRYVAPSGTDEGNNCTQTNAPCATVQHAVDVATPGDEIRIAAGTYTGVTVRTGLSQLVYIDKPVTLRGGYTPGNWTTPDLAHNPTTLDAQGQGRVMVITGSLTATVEGLRLTGGNPASRNCGGLCVVAATVMLRHNTVFSNTSGGVFVVFGSVTLNDNFVYSNTAEYGGGVYLTNSQATLSGNRISHNRATLGGGGVALERVLKVM